MTWHLGAGPTGESVGIDGDDLTTHGVIVGMTGSGKTGLGIICLEEALAGGIPVLAIDPKGDLGNLALVFPDLRPDDFEPWVDPPDGTDRRDAAAEAAEAWRSGLEASGIGRDRLATVAASPVTIHTPGSESGRPMNLLGSFSPPVADDAEAARDEARALVSSVLLMAGIDADPVADPRHVLLAAIVEAAWAAGDALDLERLIARVLDPPMRKLGVFEVDRFIGPGRREELALRLNALIASPSASSWMVGDPLDIDHLLAPVDGRPPARIVSIAHLDDASRQFVVATVLAKVVSWARRQPGTDRLRALVYMDEVFGFAPPSAMPPAKQPILTLLKQGRAHGVGLLLATQNPMDLDYKAMSNAGTWLIGRLQTERDQARVLEGMRSVTGDLDLDELSTTIAGLRKRQFVLHATRRTEPVVLDTRWAMSYLAGPLSTEGLDRLTVDGAGGRPEPVESPPSTDLEDDEVAVPPAVADGVPVSLVAPTAPWLTSVGGDPTGRRLVAAVAARVAMHFDERHADVAHDETWEAVFLPAPSPTDPGLGIAVDHDDRDFVDAPSDGAVHVIPDEPIGSASYWRSLRGSLVDALAAERRVTVFRNPDLRLYGRVGEDSGTFADRCAAAAEAGADEELASLRDRYESRVRTARERLGTAEGRFESLLAELEADRMDEVVGGIGDLLGAFAGGRSGSAGLRRAAKRRSGIQRSEQRLDTARDAVADRRAAIQEIEADLADDVEAITSRWDARAAAIEELQIGLEESDVRVLDLRLVWIPTASD
ncbi:MAG: DUF87 domain-containing protein [Acidimicrobiia bacterium]